MRALVATRGPRAGKVQAQIAHMPHQRVVLEQRAVMLEGLREVCGLVLRAKPAPSNEIGAWRDGGGRVDLQQCQPPHDREQVRWPGRIE